MLSKISCLISILLTIQSINIYAQEQTRNKLKWWNDAKFGMFIHWGVSTVKEGIHNGKQIEGSGEWIMFREKIPVSEYKALAKSFNPSRFNPDEIVLLAKEAGMKYIIFTSKHHDGFGMFDSKVTDWDVVDATPYGKDIVRQLYDASVKYDIPLGLYYSHAQDWIHPGGNTCGPIWDSLQKGDMMKYIDEISVPQVKEILTNYGELPILWWDTPFNMTYEMAEKFLPIIEKHPDLITNSRLYRGIEGDYETPEQYIPSTDLRDFNWEVCMTTNDSWGYKSSDQNWKSAKEIVFLLTEIISKGGNFLLNIGPKPDGSLPSESVKLLKTVGTWVQRNEKAIYGTTASPFPYIPWGDVTQDGNKLFLFVKKWPKDNILRLDLPDVPVEISLLKSKELKLNYKITEDIVSIDLNGVEKDSLLTVIEVETRNKVKREFNLARLKSVRGSSSKGENTPQNIVDGNPHTKWVPNENDTTAWCEIDLGEQTELQAFSIAEPWVPWANKGQELMLQRKDNMVWVDVLHVKSRGTGFTRSFEPVKTRFIRLKIISAPEPCIGEIELY